MNGWGYAAIALVVIALVVFVTLLVIHLTKKKEYYQCTSTGCISTNEETPYTSFESCSTSCPIGPVGPTGSTGSTGPVGPTGSTGPVGPTGSTGSYVASGVYNISYYGTLGPTGTPSNIGYLVPAVATDNNYYLQISAVGHRWSYDAQNGILSTFIPAVNKTMYLGFQGLPIPVIVDSPQKGWVLQNSSKGGYVKYVPPPFGVGCVNVVGGNDYMALPLDLCDGPYPDYGYGFVFTPTTR